MTEIIELTYKGFIGQARYDAYAGLFHGEVVDHRDVITFQAISTDEIEAVFIQSVDDYLAFCSTTLPSTW